MSKNKLILFLILVPSLILAGNRDPVTGRKDGRNHVRGGRRGKSDQEPAYTEIVTFESTYKPGERVRCSREQMSRKGLIDVCVYKRIEDLDLRARRQQLLLDQRSRQIAAAKNALRANRSGSKRKTGQ